MQGWGIVLAALAYVALLFVVAHWGDRNRETLRRRDRGTIYALSLAIYCTSWTFFGAVGQATTAGLDFLAIYVGPALAITLGFPLVRHMVRVAKRERITSVADFLAARYGKNAAVGALATLIAVVGTLPYIALQLKAIAASVDIMVRRDGPSVLELGGAPVDTALAVTMLLALFAILFGTRHADATEHQDGMVLAVAMESIVKLTAFVAVGLFVTFVLFDGPAALVAAADASDYVQATFRASIDPLTFVVHSALAGFAFLLLPRQFHVAVVENRSERDLHTARWMFPLYLVVINLFVLPVALGGMLTFGQSIDGDAYVLALPLSADATGVSMLVFIGGLSAATAMVIVACVTLAIMICNNVVLPLMLGSARAAPRRRAMASTLITIRRTAIVAVCAMAFLYYELAQGTAALAQFGLLAFAAIAQFVPAFVGGLAWRGATARGAIAGMAAGFAAWTYTLLVPTLLPDGHALLTQGPAGLAWARPQALFGFDVDPLNHGVLVSLSVNALAFALVSLTRRPTAMERMQAAGFALAGRRGEAAPGTGPRAVRLDELTHTVASYLGEERAARAFRPFVEAGCAEPGTLAPPEAIAHAEQLLASAIGAASSRLVMSLLMSRHDPIGETTIRLLDDASAALQHNHDILTAALDQVDQGIAVFDRDVRLASWNRRFRQLLAIPESLGLPGTALGDIVRHLTPRVEGRWGEADVVVEALLGGQRPVTFTLRLVPGGGERIVELVSRPTPDGGIVVSVTDMTRREHDARALQTANETLERRVRERTEALTAANADLASAREAAERANRSKTSFLAAAGHDILQPLNAARLYASSLAERLDGSGEQALARNVDESLESVEEILGAVLAISRLDSGRLEPEVASVPVSRLFRRLEIEFAPLAQARGLTLDIRSNGLGARSDASLLHRLLQNLVSNAVKYTDRGRVTVDATVRRDRLVFTVSDTGPGIAEGDRERIFKEFQRLHDAHKRASGLGLGLSIVQRLARVLHHELTLESVLGRGTTFHVSTPLAALAPAPAIAPVAAAGQPPGSLAGLRVACLDNEPRILDGMRGLLEGWRCEVSCFGTVADLLDATRAGRFDILLADFHLDRDDGLDAIVAARRACGGDLRTALVTADRSAALRRRAEALDVVVLNKPVKPAALRAWMARAPRTITPSAPVAPSAPPTAPVA